MLKRVLSVLALIVVGLFCYIWLFNISPKDVVAYHELDTPVATAAFRAGDLVSISPDGQRIVGRLCSMDVDGELIDSIPLAKRYSNALRDSVPDFAKLVGWAKELAGAGETAVPDFDKAQYVPFVGHVTSVNAGAPELPSMTDSCACSVARALVKREKVCTVSRSLVETVLVPRLNDETENELKQRTIGVSFRDRSVVIPDVSVLQCEGDPLNSEARAPAQVFDCSRVGGHKPDVFLRATLGVIVEADFQQGPPAPGR